MSSSNNHESIDRIPDFLASIRERDVRLWLEKGQLHYRAPKGALSQETIHCLSAARDQIVALLEKSIGAVNLEPRLKRSRAPLAFSQLAHWHLYRLSERRAIRQIASATRLCGRLNIELLRQSLAEIVRRHDALRTRIVMVDGTPAQEIAGSAHSELKVDDLTELSESTREAEINRLIGKLVLEPIDVSVGPLFGGQLLKCRENEHVLIVAMEHIISDELSMNILLRDLLTAYMQTVRGRTASLPEMPVQFADYAIWQRNAHRVRIEKYGEYWNERLTGYQRLRFPEDKELANATGLGWGTVRFRIGRYLKAGLREWSRLRRTTLVMSVFTAYAGLVLRWCDASTAAFQYQSDGRASSDIENMIGCFTSVLYLRIGLLEGDSFIDLLNRITEEYCKAYEIMDSTYIAAQASLPGFAQNTVFNWIPQGSNLHVSDLDGSEDAITCSRVSFPHPVFSKLELDREPGILLFDADDEIVGGVNFPMNRFSVETIERFAQNFLVFIRSLLEQPEGRVKTVAML